MNHDLERLKASLRERYDALFAGCGLTGRGYKLRGHCSLHGGDDRSVLSVNIYEGTWHCFKCDAGGDFLLWLARSRGYIEPGQKLHGEAWHRTVEEARRMVGMPSGNSVAVSQTFRKPPAEPRDDFYGLLKAAIPMEGTPAEQYVVHERMAWPENQPLPSNIMFVPASALTELTWNTPPPSDTAGAVAYVMRNAKGEPRALEMDALTIEGKRTEPRWRRSRGVKTGAWFSQNGASGDVVGICEGPLTALALLQTKSHLLLEARATGGMNVYDDAITDALEKDRRVMLFPDGSAAANLAAFKASDKRDRVSVVPRELDGTDKLDDLVALRRMRKA